MTNKPVEVPALLDSAAIGKLVASCNKRGKSLREDRQTALIQGFLHFLKHGDATHTSNLRNGCTKANQRMIDVYVEAFGGMIFDTEIEQYKKNKVEGVAVDVDLQGALNNKFWSYAKVSAVDPKDLSDIRKQLLRVLKTAEQDLSEADLDRLVNDITASAKSAAPLTALKMQLVA